MGRCASATVAYGVDLGNPEYAEWNFESDEDGFLGPLADELDEDELEWEDLIAEFAGWGEVDLAWDKPGTPQYDVWSAQRDRHHDALATAGVSQGHYGYEYSGIYLRVGERHHVDIDCAPLERLVPPTTTEVLRLMRFLNFLDSKGLVLKPEHRQPHWLLMATYG